MPLCTSFPRVHCKEECHSNCSRVFCVGSANKEMSARHKVSTEVDKIGDLYLIYFVKRS